MSIRATINSINDRLRRKDIVNLSASVEHFDRMKGTAKKVVQWQRLSKIVSWAVSNSPYYGNILDALSYRELKDIPEEAIGKLPILTKKIIRRNQTALQTRGKGLKVEHNTSGGSTGEPIVIPQCANYRIWREAYKRHYRKLSSGMNYQKVLRVWGSERDILENSFDLRAKIRSFLKMIKSVNAFRMSPQDVHHVAAVINRYKPDIIEAYAVPLYEIARHINRNGLSPLQPRGIMVTAGTLYSFMEDELREAFKAAVLNRYGSREVSDMACSCDGRNFLHVSMLTHFIEIVDENGHIVEDGTSGNILVTSLTNMAMPLIRYEIGDRGILRRNSICPKCGWEGDLLEEVSGRTVDLFRGEDGTMVDGEYFTHLFYFREWLEKFQVIQESLRDITINVVRTAGHDNIPEYDIQNIEDAIHKVLPSVRIEWNEVEDITYDPSGKSRYTISRVTECPPSKPATSFL